MSLIWIVPITIVIAILYAIYLIRDMLRRDTGTPQMLEVSNIIYEGAVAFLRRQYQTIAMLAIGTALLIGLLIALFERYIEVEGVTPTQLGVATALAFLIGALLSSVSGILSMWTAVKSNVRVAAAARRGADCPGQAAARR